MCVGAINEPCYPHDPCPVTRATQSLQCFHEVALCLAILLQLYTAVEAALNYCARTHLFETPSGKNIASASSLGRLIRFLASSQRVKLKRVILLPYTNYFRAVRRLSFFVKKPFTEFVTYMDVPIMALTCPASLRPFVTLIT